MLPNNSTTSHFLERNKNLGSQKDLIINFHSILIIIKKYKQILITEE